MLGAIIGDIAGSRFEWKNIKTKEFELFSSACRPTDDSVMTLAIAQAILNCNNQYNVLGKEAISCMQQLGQMYPRAGYGGSFSRWLRTAKPKPYNSFGNGAAMRVSACAYAANSLEEAKALSYAVTAVTHNHPEGLKGAEATTAAIFMALHGSSAAEIRELICREYYPIDFKLDDIRPRYAFDVSCQGSVPQALEAFFESVSFEDAIRNAISIGGDSDTIAAIAGAVAGAYYGIPAELRKQAVSYLSDYQLRILLSFEEQFGVVPDRAATIL